MIGFLVRSPMPAAGAAASVQNGALGQGATGVTRPLFGAPVLRSGGWVRQVPAPACSFDPAVAANASMLVPVLTAPGGTARPDSVFLQPSWDWTLEVWLKPAVSTRQRVVTFLDNVTPVAAGAPQLSYCLETDGQEVLQFTSYAKTRGAKDSRSCRPASRRVRRSCRRGPSPGSSG